MQLNLLYKLEQAKPFTENEAWGLFRIAALSEAVGWTLLIIGVLINRYKLPGHSISITIAGQIHGTIFLVYFVVLMVTYSSLGWSRKKIICAAMAGVPPYGTFLFEQWAAYKRQNQIAAIHLITILLVFLNDHPGQTFYSGI
jgi:integral membrane protein